MRHTKSLSIKLLPLMIGKLYVKFYRWHKVYGLLIFCILGRSYGEGNESVPLQRVRRNEVIFIDPGHGGKDQGTASKESHYEEKSLTLSLAFAVQSYLKRMGYKPVLTRTSDVYVDLSKRAALANQGKADIFVSIHCNYSSNSSAFGTEIYFYNGKYTTAERARSSEALAKHLLNAMQKHGALKSRGVKEGNFAVIRETLMPAVLVETGFLSNSRERAALLDARYRMHLAKGIAEGIHTFLTGPDFQKMNSMNVKNKKNSVRAG
ncbi:N-acetylmuramoyl-L-alanine amidase family protein [Chlamydia avium 10DC88]|uniref:N-acetylmuramoyl-L-alanine amidase n=2 Tax=Chlamydia avium TaxID=1457141 RepID=W8JL74_9CHLA|nr:N-acetylmuramoyl-L-alanine amidase [Chlamydia avium]AHK63054.1 N-acetylmuramoyl-L-alanine amidase family protein [Chlamydia avium 10DC88]